MAVRAMGSRQLQGIDVNHAGRLAAKVFVPHIASDADIGIGESHRDISKGSFCRDGLTWRR